MAAPLGALALGRMRLGNACIGHASRRVPTLTVLWRRCSQYKEVATDEDLPVPMENPYKEPNKKCILCGKTVDYKNVQLLSQFVSPFTGCIYGRHLTGLCGKKQKEITKAIKRAQIMVLHCFLCKCSSSLTTSLLRNGS
ncbi:28S ribosomal protein S18c, mitochondrial isoform X2 [Trichosurus vulpecula]|uniref:28S ribosomal protein S18c, mitochondrial isoform X2 n=1 Tax=Trichosurus vulpecula TaxID=9337 RepID=UPI00186B03B3|nr:28S ribosomal protein S18c, mitochondrial isoform X2 [Trichosurus vulpecula]